MSPAVKPRNPVRLEISSSGRPLEWTVDTGAMRGATMESGVALPCRIQDSTLVVVLHYFANACPRIMLQL